MMTAFRLLPLLVASLLAARVDAQPAEPRTLEVPANAAWQHAETGIVLPSRVEGLTRSHIRDTTQNELDVVATYMDREAGLIALVYIYRTMTPDVPLWFDRTVATIMLPQQGAAAPDVTAFARPGAATASGLRAAMSDATTGMMSTAVAIAPLDRSWQVKIRLGSTKLQPAELDARLTTFLTALRWPAETTPARNAVPIEPCETPLRLRRARILQSTTADVLIDAVSGSLVSEADDRPPPVYCREPGATVEWGVYRPNGARDAYLIALNDAGIALSVGEALDLSTLLNDGGGRRRYAVTALERNSTSVYPSFNRLPPPDQVLSVVRGSSPGLSAIYGDSNRP